MRLEHGETIMGAVFHIVDFGGVVFTSSLREVKKLQVGIFFPQYHLGRSAVVTDAFLFNYLPWLRYGRVSSLGSFAFKHQSISKTPPQAARRLYAMLALSVWCGLLLRRSPAMLG